MALEAGTIVKSGLDSQSFSSSIQNNVNTIALFENEKDVINLNKQFLEKKKVGDSYVTSMFHESIPLEGLRFANEVLINDQEMYNGLLASLKIDGSS